MGWRIPSREPCDRIADDLHVSSTGLPPLATTRHQEWQGTVLMSPREGVEIAFVADNPGDWMFHCHILEHQAAGMMGVIRLT